MSKVSSFKTVLAVVDSEYPVDFNIIEILNNEAFLKAAVKYAEKNGLYYQFISGLSRFDISLNTSQEKRWLEEKEKLEDYKETIRILNKCSQKSKIDYVLIKACNSILHVPRDVDIYIRDKDQSKFIESLEKEGMACIHSDDVDTTLVKGEHMKIDLYTGLCYFTYEFIDSEFIFGSCEKDFIFAIEYPGLKPESNLLVILVHSLFGHSSMTLLDFLHMKSLISEINDINVCRNYAYSKGWGNTFDLTINEINRIIELIYVENKDLIFPYFFGRRFVFKCISGIQKLTLTNSNKLFLEASIFQDFIVVNLKNTPFYNTLRSFEPTRRVVSSVGYFIRNMRGDKRS